MNAFSFNPDLPEFLSSPKARILHSGLNLVAKQQHEPDPTPEACPGLWCLLLLAEAPRHPGV